MEGKGDQEGEDGRPGWETRRKGTGDQEGGDGRPGGRGWETRRELGDGRPGGRGWGRGWETRREGMGDQEGGDGRPGGRGWETRREWKGDQCGRMICSGYQWFWSVQVSGLHVVLFVITIMFALIL